MFKRYNAHNNGGTFENANLLWYAKGVGVMQSRALDDPTSWFFFAAIHGQNLVNDINSGNPPNTDYRNWANIQGPPAVPVAPLPPATSSQLYWDQCQHGTWYFLPWHRGYLFALENILREIIQSLGGPSDWALPYWNYFGGGGQSSIPSVFVQKVLPDGTPNPLYVKARFGYRGNGNVDIRLGDINESCQEDANFTGVQPDNYGGAESGFEHGNYDNRGSIEANPHNEIHVEIGGQDLSGRGGLMGFPRTAALDPIFYLHHCNIDRMWAAWNTLYNNPTASNWLEGPAAIGDRKFCMPKLDKSPWEFTPSMVNDTNLLNYSYDDINLPVSTFAFNKNLLRLRNFGLTLDNIESFSNMRTKGSSELIGSNNGIITLGANSVSSTVNLDSRGWNKVAKSLRNTFESSFTEGPLASNLPDQVYLQLEGIKGKEDSIVCLVSVNNQHVGRLSLFGLHDSSVKNGHHGGAGLTIRYDISKIVDQLHLGNTIDTGSLQILIQPENIVAPGNELTIDRISVYRQSQI